MIKNGPSTFETRFSTGIVIPNDSFLMNAPENEFRGSNVTYASTVNCCTNVLQLLQLSNFCCFIILRVSK